MNIAFSTILIFLLILPGLAFRRFYYTGEFSKEYFRTTIFEIFALGVIPSIILHVFWYNILPQATPLEISMYFTEIEVPKITIDFRVLGLLLSGQGDFAFYNEIFSAIGNKMNSVLLYFFITICSGGVLGFFSKVMVRRLKLDRKWKLLRFQNEWHYILSSEILDLRKNGHHGSEGMVLEAVWVDALVETDEGSILYTGIIDDYKLSRDGGLELLYLVNSYRRFLKDDDKGLTKRRLEGGSTVDSVFNEGYYQLPEHYLILKYSNISNLNIYYQFGEKPKGDYRKAIEITLGVGINVLIYWGFHVLTNSSILAIISLIIVQYVLTRFSEKPPGPDENEGLPEHE